MNSYNKLLDAIKAKDFSAATTQFRDIMEQKIAIRMAREMQRVAKTSLVSEAESTGTRSGKRVKLPIKKENCGLPHMRKESEHGGVFGSD